MIVLFIFIIILLALSAFFSGSETSLMSLSRTEVSRMSTGSPKDRAVCSLLKKPQQLLSTILVGNMFVNILLTSLFSILFTKLLHGDGCFIIDAYRYFSPGASDAQCKNVVTVCEFLLNILVVTPLLMVFGEQTPKVLAYAHGVALARFAARPLQFLCWVLTPINWIMRVLANFCLMLIGQNLMDDWRELTIDELLVNISAGQEAGATDDSENKILSSAVAIGGILAREVMTHRVDITILPDDITVGEAYAIALEKKHSLYPVCAGSYDGVWGIFSLMTLPFWRGKPEMNMSLSSFKDKVNEYRTEQLPIFKPIYVPETARIDNLLYEMRRKAISFCVVVDEYGGVSGVITLTDIMEELMGHFSGSHDDEDTLYKMDNGSFIANGGAHLRLLQQRFGEAFANEEGDADTIAGLIMEQLGSVPRAGSVIELEDGSRITVVRMQGRRISKVRIFPGGKVSSDTGEPETTI